MTSAFTLAAWVKPGAATGEFETIAGREGSTSSASRPTARCTGSCRPPRDPGVGAGPVRRSSSQRDVWAHVALVYDGSSADRVSERKPPARRLVHGRTDRRCRARARTSSASAAAKTRRRRRYFTGAIDDVLLLRPGVLSRPNCSGSRSPSGDGLCGPRPTTVTVTPDPVTVPYGASASTCSR